MDANNFAIMLKLEQEGKKKNSTKQKENKAKKNKQNVNKDGTTVHHRLNKTV